MISPQLKEFATKTAETGWDIWAVPSNVLVDKTTGQPKASEKNMKMYNLVQLWNKMTDEEKALFRFHRGEDNMNPELTQLLKSLVYSERQLYIVMEKIADVGRDYLQKMKQLEAKFARDTKKAETENAKQQLVNQLDRSDIAKSINTLTSQIEPYIKQGEVSIDEKVKKQAKLFTSDWNEVVEKLSNAGISVKSDSDLYNTIQYGSVVQEGKRTRLINLLMYGYQSFSIAWINRNKESLNNTATWIAKGQVQELIQQTQKMFRDGQILKISTLFFRLIKSNPTLKNYNVSSPYDGNEFELTAINDKGETVIIKTNTIQAGGYNIQRLHNRWLVEVRNTVTGKLEKFTLEEKESE